ncbi:hypothetical protein SDC9_188209 [bioreactor metagenome]|uniref:Uncharacterized protein n=1 Tax=bioreactor metagenome TaxID=1076179 RepID=A0A645HNP7_9ZZZZ
MTSQVYRNILDTIKGGITIRLYRLNLIQIKLQDLEHQGTLLG